MCTLLTIHRTLWDADPQAYARRIIQDSNVNSDGAALLLGHADGTYSSVRSFSMDVMLGVLAGTDDWERMWLHQRWATQGAPSLENTHAFCSKGVWYMHNGSLSQAPARQMPVDTMAIGKWIQDNVVYSRLASENYANVFLIAPHSGTYTVVRGGTGGTLFTDGQGNFSTNEVGPIKLPVQDKTKSNWKCPETVVFSRWARPVRKVANDPSLPAHGAPATPAPLLPTVLLPQANTIPPAPEPGELAMTPKDDEFTQSERDWLRDFYKGTIYD